MGKENLPNQQECNRYKDIFNSVIYLLYTGLLDLHMYYFCAYNTYVNTHNKYESTHFSKTKSLFALYN